MSSTDNPKMSLSESSRRKAPYVGISLMILSVLLTASVAALVYLAVSNSQAACQQSAAQTPEVDVKANINVETEDGNEINERVEYSRNSRIAFYYGSDGSFDVDDFGKGIHITKSSDASDDQVCYLIAVGSNRSSDASLDKYLADHDGAVISSDSDLEYELKVLDGEITDTSFLPQQAIDRCHHGFKWMDVVPKGSLEAERMKRDQCLYLVRICTTYYDNGALWRSCTYYLVTGSC